MRYLVDIDREALKALGLPVVREARRRLAVRAQLEQHPEAAAQFTIERNDGETYVTAVLAITPPLAEQLQRAFLFGP